MTNKVVPIPLETVLVLHGVLKRDTYHLASEVSKLRGCYRWLAQDGTGWWYLYCNKPRVDSTHTRRVMAWEARWNSTGEFKERIYQRIMHTAPSDNWNKTLIDITNLV